MTGVSNVRPQNKLHGEDTTNETATNIAITRMNQPQAASVKIKCDRLERNPCRRLLQKKIDEVAQSLQMELHH